MGLTTITTGPTQGTLAKADGLEIADVRQEVPATSAMRPTEPAVQAVASAGPVANKIISQHWRDPNDFSSATKQKQTGQTGSSKKGNSSIGKGIELSIGPNLQSR